VNSIIRISRTKLELLCYIRTEFDPLCIMFDACDDNIIHSVEQKVSRKVIVAYSIYCLFFSDLSQTLNRASLKKDMPVT